MTDATRYQADVVIFGGGVAGLWLLARLRQAGYRALLLEAQALGAGQTRYSQGIIHGGTKYALTGAVSDASEAILSMPPLWRACLAGSGEIDLRRVRLMSDHQYLWSTASITSRMAGFFASKLMRSRVAPLSTNDYPAVFRNGAFRGQVYKLEEPVLDAASLVHELAEPHRAAIWQVKPEQLRAVSEDADGVTLTVDNGGRELTVQCRRVVFAAGKGNAALLSRLGHSTPAMQLRPLKMVAVRGNLPEGVYAHCLGASANPRITISTHYDLDGGVVWYLGGDLAEDGVKRSDAEQVAVARRELSALLPWIDFADCEFNTFDIDRAEVRTPDGRRPEDSFAGADGAVIAVWPTKLAFAPRAAAHVIKLLEEANVTPGGDNTALPDVPFPGYALLPWQERAAWPAQKD